MGRVFHMRKHCISEMWLVVTFERKREEKICHLNFILSKTRVSMNERNGRRHSSQTQTYAHLR